MGMAKQHKCGFGHHWHSVFGRLWLFLSHMGGCLGLRRLLGVCEPPVLGLWWGFPGCEAHQWGAALGRTEERKGCAGKCVGLGLLMVTPDLADNSTLSSILCFLSKWAVKDRARWLVWNHLGLALSCLVCAGFRVTGDLLFVLQQQNEHLCHILKTFATSFIFSYGTEEPSFVREVRCAKITFKLLLIHP